MQETRTFKDPARRRSVFKVGLLFLAAAAAVSSTQGQSGPRRVAIILDTSSSMRDNDAQRYGVQLSQVVSDLTNDSDQLTLIRFPHDGTCSDQADLRLARRLDTSDRQGFKRQLDQFLRYRGGTHFAAPIRTAAQVLGRDSSHQRMLLIIADSGGLGACTGVMTDELMELGNSGAFLAAINLDRARGAFEQNPALDFTTGARNPQEMVEAVAQVYQRFLGAKKVQTGQVSGQIEVEIEPYCKEAFLVTIADGRMGGVVSLKSNPAAAAIDADYRGGGSVTGLDRVLRQYRIVRLDRPLKGRWAFEVPDLGGRAAWMLLQDFSIGVRAVTPTVRPGATTLEVELFDETTGKRIADLSELSGLSVTIENNGRQVQLNDQGREGDKRAADGILSAPVDLGSPGRKRIQVQVGSDILDLSRTLEFEVADVNWRMSPITPSSTPLGSGPIAIAVRLTPQAGGRVQPGYPDYIEASAPELKLRLLDDGSGGDQKAGDGIYSASWTPTKAGEFEVRFRAVGGSPADDATTRIRVTDTAWTVKAFGASSFDLDYPTVLSVRLEAEIPGSPPLKRPNAIRVEGDGLSLLLNDSGRDGDARTGDGLYSVSWTPDKAGRYRVVYRGVGDARTTPTPAVIQVAELGWRLEPQTPTPLEVDSAATIAVSLAPTKRGRISRRPPDYINAEGEGISLRLSDDGQTPDAEAGDLVYSGHWTPDRIGEFRLDFRAIGGSTVDTVTQFIEVGGRLEISPPPPLEVGPLQSGSIAEATLDFGASTVKGRYRFALGSDVEQAGVGAEVFDGQDWQPLSATPVQLTGQGLRWPLRFSVEDCPQGSAADWERNLTLTVAKPSGEIAGQFSVPLRLTVLEDSFLACWWPVIVGLLGVGIVGVIVHGYWWPSRFGGRLGVVISQEEDIASEGFFHPIKGEKGTRSGFYRHAACFVCADYRLRGKAINAIARLRAQGNSVLIQPTHGAVVYRRTLDDEWEPLPATESRARFGALFRDDGRRVYFEVRTG